MTQGPNNKDCIEKCLVKEDKYENKPNLLCRDENKLVVSWLESRQNDSKYLIEYRPQFSENWKQETIIAKIPDKNFVSIKNLTGGYIFRIKIFSDGKPTGVIMESEVLYTLPRNKSLSEIKKAWITDFVPHGTYLTTTLNWEPISELVCGYHIVIGTIGKQEVEEIIPTVEDLYHVKINNLFYSMEYVIQLYAETEFYASEYYLINFKTPSCNEINNYDYNICGPVKPSNLSAYFEECKAIIMWMTPHKFPDSYLVKIIMLTNGAQLNFTINGKENSFDIDTTTFSKSFEIHLRAIAKNKESPATFIRLKNQCKIMNNRKTEGKKNETKEDTVSERQAIIIVMLFLTLIVLGSFVFIFCQMEKKSDGVKKAKETKDKYIGYDITSNMITLKEVIGKGEFGVVFKAVIKTQKEETQVAVKTLRSNATKEDIESFQEEVEVMRTVGKHENLVSLIGYCPNEKFLVVEYCALGDLQNFLREARKTKLLIQELVNSDFAETNRFQDSNIVSNMIYERTEVEQKHLKLNIVDLLYLTRQVATGMEYLTNNKIIHRDLATRNILLTLDLMAKISDFGLSRDIYEESIYRKKRVSKLPIKWMAIESLSHHIFTSQSDVWSFGILLWEVMTLGGAPYPSIPSAQVYKLLKTGYRMEKPPSCNGQVYEIMTLCWKEKPYNRPSFSQIITKLDKILNNGSVQNDDSFDTKSLNYAHIGSMEE
ncbi:tyrosine-protein kinase receptor torso [Halyomorpha halys]|uniref:tyrosine-protein kinase receptor torso n=1 Tax=Halyomorpha halys TaxID=286706 RepID=UPI0034D27F14